MARSAFPLQWPEGYSRTKPDSRLKSKFGHRIHGVSFSLAYDLLRAEIRRLGGINEAITTDLPLRNDGIPYAAQGRVPDPGVAAWMIIPDDRGTPIERVFACDRWPTHAENMIALAKTIEALRGMDRWGCADVTNRALAGFAALPPGTPPPRTWREVIGGTWPAGLEPADTLAIAKSRYRARVAEVHPDRGGDPAEAAAVTAAMEAAEAELEPKGTP